MSRTLSLSMDVCAKEASKFTVANDGCAALGLRGGKVETEKRGSLVGFRKKAKTSDVQLYVGRQLLIMSHSKKKFGKDATRRD